jgi:hypothetical protein
VAEHPKVFHHVGLLVNEPPRYNRVALYLVPKQAKAINLFLVGLPNDDGIA